MCETVLSIGNLVWSIHSTQQFASPSSPAYSAYPGLKRWFFALGALFWFELGHSWTNFKEFVRNKVVSLNFLLFYNLIYHDKAWIFLSQLKLKHFYFNEKDLFFFSKDICLVEEVVVENLNNIIWSPKWIIFLMVYSAIMWV